MKYSRIFTHAFYTAIRHELFHGGYYHPLSTGVTVVGYCKRFDHRTRKNARPFTDIGRDRYSAKRLRFNKN